MMDLKDKISGFFKKIQDFFSNNIKTVIIITCVVIFILVLVLILIFISFGNKNIQSDNQDKKAVLSSQLSDFKSRKINSDKLQLIDEPLNLPPIQFSREQLKVWEKTETDYWYEPPTEKDMEELHKKNKEIVDNILEASP